MRFPKYNIRNIETNNNFIIPCIIALPWWKKYRKYRDVTEEEVWRCSAGRGFLGLTPLEQSGEEA